MNASGGVRRYGDRDTEAAAGGEYVFIRRNGVGERLVTPYAFEFTAGVKQRWQGKTLLEVFMREFPIRTREYYIQAIRSGRLAIRSGRGKTKSETKSENESTTTTTTTKCSESAESAVLRNGDVVVHRVHRHEPPVFARDLPIVILGRTSAFLAVKKPAGMPVHPCGQYRENTLLRTIERQEEDIGPIYACNRLDVPVSGVVVLARSTDDARRLCTMHGDRCVRKLYVARVEGDFGGAMRTAAAGIMNGEKDEEEDEKDEEEEEEGEDAGMLTCEAPLGYDPRTRRAFVADLALDREDGEGANGGGGGGGGGGEGGCTSRKRKQATASTRDKDGKRLGSYAKTKFRMLWRSPDGASSCVLCEPVTGRTHQIRIHLAHLGHPIVNDIAYNPACCTSDDAADGAGCEKHEAVVCEIVGTMPAWTVDDACPHCPRLRSPDFDTKPPQELWLHALHYAAPPLFSFSCPPPDWAMRGAWSEHDRTTLLAELPDEMGTQPQ